MAMTGLEKRFVNRQSKAERNIEKVRRRLAEMDIAGIQDMLELGCGIGAVSAFLSQNYPMRVIGTDYDPQQVKLARVLYPEGERLRFQIENAADLSFTDASFDLVISQNVFHHVPAWRRAVREAARVLREGGFLIWLDLSFPGFLQGILRPFVKNYAIYRFDEVMDEFKRNDFTQLFYERLSHGPFGHHHLVLCKGSRGG